MDNQKGYENSGVDDILRAFDKGDEIEKQPSEEIDFKKVKVVGNAVRNTSGVDEAFKKAWKNAFGTIEEDSFEVDDSYKNIVRLSEMIESLEEVLNELKKKPIVSELKEKVNISNLKEKGKKTDTWKTLVETITSIKQSIDEIVLLTDPMLQVGEEAKERGLKSPILDKLDNEIQEIQELQGYDFDRAVKQVIGKKVVEIGKTTIKGAVTLGFNAIGASVKGIRKVVDKVNDFRSRRENDLEEEQIFENEEIFEKSDDEYNKYVNYNSTSQDIPFDLSQHKIKPNGELDFSRYRVKDNKNILGEVEVEEKESKENLVKKTIKGFKDFGTEVGKKFKWIKDKEARQAFKNKQKEKFKNLRRNVAKKIRNTNAYKEAETNYYIARSVAAGVKEEIKSIPDKVTNTYEQAKERYNKRRNDKLILALNKGRNFSEKQLEDIKSFIENAKNENELKQSQTQKRRSVEPSTLDR